VSEIEGEGYVTELTKLRINTKTKIPTTNRLFHNKEWFFGFFKGYASVTLMSPVIFNVCYALLRGRQRT